MIGKQYKDGEILCYIHHNNGEKSHIEYNELRECFITFGYVGNGWEIKTFRDVILFFDGRNISLNEIFF